MASRNIYRPTKAELEAARKRTNRWLGTFYTGAEVLAFNELIDSAVAIIEKAEQRKTA